MAAGYIRRLVLWSLALPHVIVSYLVSFVGLKTFREDLESCLYTAETYSGTVPNTFVRALVLAEDHRYQYHPGIDGIAVLRAIWVWLRSKKLQGASTIEQQFVRVVTDRYRITISRKLREQLLAIIVARHTRKLDIASAYLAIAFYGVEYCGLSGLIKEYGDDLSVVTFREAVKTVSQLKYPKPRGPDRQWSRKIAFRSNRLIKRSKRIVELFPPPDR